MPGSAPYFLAKAVAKAAELDLFNHSTVRLILDLGQLPEWLQQLQEPDGFEDLERLFGVRIPAVLKEFWSRPDLVCAWKVIGVDALDEPPAVEQWTEGEIYLTFDRHQHSGCAAAVRLDGSENPPVVLEFDPENVLKESFSRYLEDGFECFARRSQR